MRQWIERSLLEVVPRDHRQSTRDLRRRRVVTVGFVLLGAMFLGVLLRLDPGSAEFTAASFGLAGVWAVGAVASGPLHLGRIVRHDMHVRPVVQPLALGFGLAGVFVLGSLVVREIDPLRDQVADVLDFASEGTLWVLVVVTTVNGIAEELFFRGAAYAAITRHPVAWTSVAYTIATAATGNVMLSFAAVLLGILCGLQRRASGGILAPILTHCAWSLTMLLALPPLFGV